MWTGRRKKTFMAVVKGAALMAVAFWALTEDPTVASETSQLSRQPAFTVATVRPNPTERMGMTIRTLPGGRFTATNVPLQRLIRRAYGLQTLQVLGGPDWMDADRFDIVATFDPEELDGWNRWLQRDNPRVMLMLQNLLVERFNLQMHTETRDMQYYALVLAKANGQLGEGIQPSTIDCAAYYQAREQAQRPDGAPGNIVPTGAHCGLRLASRGLLETIESGAVVMPRFAESLQIFLGAMVRDETGLEGLFDVDVTFLRDPALAPELPVPPGDTGVGPSIFAAVQEQLGLELESRLGPIEVLVVDHVEQPTPN